MIVSRDVERWYKLNPHPVQNALIADNVRFKVVPAGRRSGKTEHAKRFVVREALRVPMPYFVAAPTRDQVKRIYWSDLKRLSFSSLFGDRSVSESDLIIKFPNGSTISLIGLDQPQRMEGVLWGGGIIDEIADIKAGAWQENISPALDTYNPSNPGYRPWCWLIGVPDGLNHYYDLAEYARTSNDKDWKLYTWKSSDILPADVIESAKRRLSPRQFKQEYEASFETATGRIYEDYGVNNITSETIRPNEMLLWCHDFNFSPLSSCIAVRRDESLFCLDEIILNSAIARQAAIEFCDRFKDHENRKVIIYGDPAGRAGEKHGHTSDYTEIEKVLRSNMWSVERRVKSAAPAIRDRHNALRAKILNASGESSLFVNPSTCKYLHKGLNTVSFKKGSTFLEDETEYQHVTTAIGYCVDYEFPIKKDKPVYDTRPNPTVNFFKGKL